MPVGILSVSDFGIEVSRGIAGYTPVNKFGKNTDIDTAQVPQDIWESPTNLWVAPVTAEKHDIASTDVADKGTPTEGTGARTVEIEGLNENWEVTTETVTLDGTNDVETSNRYWRIYRMKVLTAGSGGYNVGIITATTQAVGTTVTAQIAIGNNQTMMAIYTVPNERTGHMGNLWASILPATPAATRVEFQLWARDVNDGVSMGAWQLKHDFALVSDGVSYAQHEFKKAAKKFESKTDIRLSVAFVGNDNTVVTGGFDIVTIIETSH
jgi:hypothetical protein